MKKEIAVLTLTALAAGSLFAWPWSKKDGKGSDFGKNEISVISREDGSGTRGAFVELMGVEQKVNGKKVDMTTDSADITNSTEIMITSVEGNKNAIGYISLGSLNSRVKALSIDGAEATVAAIKKGTYKISRPFNIITKVAPEELPEPAADFVRFILSADGQAIVEGKGYIAAANNPKYIPTGKKGKITVAGSSSVTPVMEKLAEAYEALTPVNVEIQMSDSTTGVNSAIGGVCDIGMASRDLKSSEIEKGAKSTVIATDGIAIIVNKANPATGLSSESVRKIYTGEISKWGDAK